MAVDDVARDLYGLMPAEFVAARADRAAAAKQAGDKQLAAAIGKLRKPTMTAWAANLLSRAAPDDVDALLRLAAALAAAQRKLSAEQLRDLTAQRQQLVNALAKKAGALAAEHGHPVGENVVREIGQTLTAALADPEVADRLRAGTLATAASYEGFGPSGPDLLAVPEPAAPRGRAAAREQQDDSARRELADAEEALETARSEADSAQAALAEATGELSAAEERVATLREELDHAEQQRQFRKSAERSAKDELQAARRQVERAERRLTKARQRAGNG
ncbi:MULTISPECIES: hypothetical protein [Nocardia]|uniref:Transposase n=1 Tax=Nocardia implantans TaxID=3108168 RepID=A0ABU6AXW8_9NOCA|nr:MULTISPECIES: hypothetical protein [unclassified Nocardia]MBF6190594.1 hypothetical protein [Nocardia beijingensis]MEA3528507.1 hypothetical protein [Nocardia sp. CDC192]MEB3512341.1 hypothetical protein [Nocardia sp. CDC186]